MSELFVAILITAFYAGVYVASIMVHEIGHAWAYKHLTGKKASIKLTKSGFHLEDGKQLQSITDEQYYGILWAGIIAGFLCIGAGFVFLPRGYNLMFFPILALYLWGCKSDLFQIMITRKRLQK